MASTYAKRRPVRGGAPNVVDPLAHEIEDHFSCRSPRRQYLVRHLHAAGPRPLLEALLEIEGGARLDDVLEAYARIPVETYHALNADVLPIDELALLDGGRR
jgi:hypothetical protein